MGIVAGMTDSFKNEILSGVHNLSSNTIKIALYLDTADISPGTTAYTTSGESSGTNYTAGGNTLSGVSITKNGGTSYVDFTDSVWSSASFTAAGALIYNASQSNKSIAVLDFGVREGIIVTAGTFTVTFPSANADDAIIRIS
jgi:hypothetical protein